MIACIASVIGSATVANAQVFTLDWLVNGQNSVSVAPGSLVTVTGVASWTPAAFGLGNAQFRVNLAGSDMSDALQYSEALGLGRNPLLRFTPQVLTDAAIAGGRAITGAGNTVVDAAQGPQIINPLFTGANPVEVFRFMFVAGLGGRTVDIGSPMTSVTLMSNFMGQPTAPYTPVVDGAQIQIVPTPGSMALLGLGGVACLRRRRR